MPVSISKPLIFVVISVLVVALVYSSISAFNVIAAPNAAPSNADCKELSTSNAIQGYFTYTKCCWTETDPNDPEGIELYYCQSCYKNGNCDPKHPASQGPTSPPSGPVAPLQGGVLEQQEQPMPPAFAPGTSPGVLEQLEQTPPPFVPGFLERQQQPPADQGATELPPPPATEETQPATAEEEQSVPVCQEGLEFNEDLGFCVPTECPEGQVLDEQSGICVLEQPEAAEEEPEQAEPEEQDQQQSSEEGAGSEEQ